MSVAYDGPLPVWEAMKGKLIAGDIVGASQYFAPISKQKYLDQFYSIGTADLSAIFTHTPAVVPVFVGDNSAEYRIQQTVQGYDLAFPVNFVRENGLWRILEY